MKMGQGVPKRRYIKCRSRGIAQRKHTKFRTRQKFEIKSYFLLWSHSCANFNTQIKCHFLASKLQTDKPCRVQNSISSHFHIVRMSIN